MKLDEEVANRKKIKRSVFWIVNMQILLKDVVLFGFGRIGRLVARELIAQEGSGQQLRLRAIVARGTDAETLEKRASLLRIDSVHGQFPGTVEADAENMALIIDGRPIAIIDAKNPEDVDYTNINLNHIRDTHYFRNNFVGKGISKLS